MKDFWSDHVRQMLLLGKTLIESNPLLIEEVGTTNVKGDKTIGMDVKIEQAMINYIKKNKIPANIFSEEIGIIKFHSDPKYLIAFDPLDGSTNYKLGKDFFPYGFLVAIYQGTSPKLKDVISAGAIEYTQNLAWIYTDKKTFTIGGKVISLKKDWFVNRHTPVYLDLYYKEGYEDYRPLAEKIFIRNMGSTIGHLSYVLLNMAAGLGGVCMRPEEIGAVVSLIKGAGGIAVKNKGQDLGEEEFSFDKTYQILAGTSDVINFIVNQLK